MRKRVLFPMLLAGVFSSSLLFTGCSDRHYYRAYDPYYNDYHHWDSHENVYYQQWTTQYHHDPHVEYRNLPQDQQKQYWQWRHNNGAHGQDHGHDHDHDHH